MAETPFQIKRGASGVIPNGASGEPLWTVDTEKLYIGDGDGNNILIGPFGGGDFDHSSLTGLTNDDHLHYHTDARAMTWLLANDGTGSGIDADLLDGVHGASFLRSDQPDTSTGLITFAAGALISDGQSLTIGDDARILDIDIANYIGIQGIQDPTTGGIAFGSAKDTRLFRNSANYLRTSDFFHAELGMAAGVDNSIAGYLHLYGNATGPEGGEVRLYLSSEHDTLFEYWFIDTYEDDLRTVGNGIVIHKLDPDGQLHLPVIGTSAGIRIGNDTHMYRSAANTLTMATGDFLSYQSHPAFTSPQHIVDKQYVDDEIAAITPGSGPGSAAPEDATYIVVSSTTALSSERVFTSGANIEVTDGGPNGAFAVAVTQGAGSSLDADLLDGVQGDGYLRSDQADSFSGSITAAANILADSTVNARQIGSVTAKFGNIYATNVHTGDLVMHDPMCVACGTVFNAGDDLIMKVICVETYTEGNAVRTVPVHDYCKSLPVLYYTPPGGT